MKKSILIILCGLVSAGAFAQKANVDNAKKLAGKIDKIEEARSMIQQAMKNPETAQDAQTYYVAGKIEWDAYDALAATQQNPVEAGTALLNGYNYYLQVFDLDKLPNQKGQIKPRFTKELQEAIANKNPEFWNAGAMLYGAQKYYPEAYNAFMIFADMPELEVLGKQKPVIADTVRAIAFFNAGISAWGANKLDEAAAAFKKARENNYDGPQATLYEIGSWQNIEKDSTRMDEARARILEAARYGYETFGMEQPVFLINLVNSIINDNKEAEALELVNQAMQKYPNNSSLYGLRGYVYDRMDNDAAAVEDYRTAANLPDANFETLRSAANKLFRVGQHKWNEIELGDPDSRAKKAAIKADYFQVAKDWALKAQGLSDDPSSMDYLIESIQYQLDL